ncbi:MFS general substrate transporter [Backusella circina FSU 941]|nr:MFS general substrate transporter [Backusella circina FSU 941]
MNENTPLLGRFAQLKGPSSWYAIFPMLLVAFSGGALYAPHTQFYTEIFCNRYYNLQPDADLDTIPVQNCSIPEVQKMVSRAQAAIMFLTYASTLIGAGFYGRLSDRKGRALVFRISTMGSFIYVFCDIMTAKFHHVIGLPLLFIGPLLKGIMAGENSLMAAVQAYIADCTASSSRTIIFSRLMACLFVGSAIGPYVSSLIIKETGDIINIFYVALFVDFINVIYTMFFLPESNEYVIKLNRGEVLTKTEPKPTCIWSRLNIFSTLQILFKNPISHMSRHALPCLALTEFLLTLVKRPPTMLYAMLKFKWTAYEGSIYFTYASLVRLFIMIGVLPMLSKLFNTKCPKSTITPEGQEKKYRNSTLFDIWMVRVGIGMDAVCLALAGLATNAYVFAAAGMLQSFSMLAQPSIRGLLTTLVKPTQVGELLGAIAILDSIAMIISHLGINTIYSASVKTMPNLIFFICATIAACSSLSAFFVKKHKVSHDDELVCSHMTVAVEDCAITRERCCRPRH